MAVPRSKEARRYYRCAYRRRVEASILIKAAQPTGAVYLAGYVVECMLKALILESHPSDSRDDPPLEMRRLGHDFIRMTSFYRRQGGSGPPLLVVQALTLVGDWTTELRYDPREIPLDEADDFLKAVDVINHWVDGRI